MFTLKAIKFNSKRSYDKQNLTLVVISYEIYETRFFFSFEIMFTLKAIKFNLKRSYDKQNLTPVFISFEIYEICQRLVS